MKKQKDKWDKIVDEVDREWNCLSNTPIEFNEKKRKKVEKCIKK